MQFKIGEKVCFLNEKREGIVTKIINNKMVSIAIEDGFEIPVLMSDLAPIVLPDYIQNKKEQKLYDAPTIINPIIADDENELISPIFINNDVFNEKGVFLAYVPESDKNLLSNNLSVYLVNNTAYDLLYIYYLKENNKFIGADYDRLDAESKFLLQTIDKSQLEEWTSFRFQILFFKKGSPFIKTPLEKEISIKPIKFYKEDSYQFCSMLQQRAILLNLSSNQSIENEENIIEDKKYHLEKLIDKNKKNEINIEKKNTNEIEPIPQKHIIDRRVAEVDLHIDELLESIEGMSNSEMLKFQVNYFIKMLESAIYHKYFKIIFIHGVGNGKLKEEIRKILKETYSYLRVYDASLAKYGVGATEVQIPMNLNLKQTR